MLSASSITMPIHKLAPLTLPVAAVAKTNPYSVASVAVALFTQGIKFDASLLKQFPKQNDFYISWAVVFENSRG